MKFCFLSPVSMIFMLFIADAKAQAPYFQQKLDYSLSVVLDDETDMLRGNITINYQNNSSDTLRYIWMHMWPNGYKDRKTALSKQMLENGSTKLYFAPEKDRGLIDSISFSVNGKNMKIAYDSLNVDICKIELTEHLKPGGQAVISTPFRVKIPSSKFSRLGHTGDAFYISQWYPKPAVYDRNGWNPIPYLTQGEFYSEFAKFKVTISLPDNYVVAATGILQEESEKKWLDEKVRITSEKQEFLQTDSFPLSSSTFKTITFIQDSIHDFAWFADKRFNVLSGEVTLPVSGRKISTSVFFTNKRAAYWKNTIDYLQKGILFLSEEVGEYPFNSFSVVDGTLAAGGGMEYPMITIINSPDDAKTFESTVFHELCHNWFYGILANDERSNGWMDEGLTSWFELCYVEKFLNGKLPGDNELSGSANLLGNITGINRLNAIGALNLIYKLSAFNNSDQPIKTYAPDFTFVNYGTVMYTKTALTFNFLNDYLGDAVLQKCMQDYFLKWKFKHPGPDDIKNSFETTTGKDLDWFFDDLITTNIPISYKPKKAGEAIHLTNKSGIPIPIKLEDENGNQKWEEGSKDTLNITLPSSQSKFFSINKEYATLFKSTDLQYRSSSLHKKAPKLRLKAVPQVTDDPETETIYLLPALAWNEYDNWMAGFYFSNMDLIPEAFEFHLVPLYDFKNNSITGIASFDYNLWPISGAFREVKFSLQSRRFAYADNNSTDTQFSDKYPVFFYSKLAPGVNITLRRKNARSSITHSFGFRNISVFLDEVVYTKVDSIYERDFTNTLLNYNELTWNLENSRAIDPFSLYVRAEQGKEHIKLSFEMNYRFSYKKNNKGIDIRLFAGGFAYNNTSDRNYNFRMAGWDGSRDYLYDETFFGRTEEDGLWSKQFLVREGGFKIPTFVGQTNKWLAAVNISVDVPAPIPVKLFLDFGSYEGISTTFEGINSNVMYSGGFAITPIRDVFEIYFPLFQSEDIELSNEVNNITKFANKIRFVFNLNKLTPVSIRNRSIRNIQ